MPQPELFDDAAFPVPANPDDKAAKLIAVARGVAITLGLGETLTRAGLSELMTEGFGASDATGAWSLRDAYEACEAAQVMLSRDAATPPLRATTLTAETLLAAINQADAQLRLLPSQTFRSEIQIARQQFSTPMPIALLAAALAAPRADDLCLEPSAGTGLLAVGAHTAGARLLLNEIDPQRAAMLERIFPGTPVTRHDGATLQHRLDQRPSLVLMNPPFSRSEQLGEDAHAGARHLMAALQLLRPGGRCVAVMPAWFSPDGSGRDGYAAVIALQAPCFDLLLDGSFYAPHGTAVRVRLMAFDKGTSPVANRSTATDYAGAVAQVLACPQRPMVEIVPEGSATRTVSINAPRRSGLLVRRATASAPPPPQLALTTSDAEPLAYTALETPRPAEPAMGLYVPYRVARIAFADDVAEHPTPLVESVAMASITPPLPTYRPILPAYARRALSAAQLETVVYAGQSFERDLPGRYSPTNGGLGLEQTETGTSYRAGFFLGDGTGAGKGRQVAGIIMDSWCQGRRRHLWVSKTTSLIEDARRDWAALGGIGIDIQSLAAVDLDKPITIGSGILFVTYATLRSERAEKGSRLDQIIAWLGGDAPDGFEGVIVFDESHAMANAAGTETARGLMKGSEQGIAGVKLQHLLPRARVLYVSATGATEVGNLAYATRLGLWGSGTAFSTREGFMQDMRQGGIAAMELVARDLKAMGFYTARALSYAGIEYDILDHRLTPEQIEVYDSFCAAWEIIHQNLEAVLRATNVNDPITGETLNGQARGAAMSKFEGAKQRFFAQVLTAMKLPSLIPAIDTDLAAGHSVVIQLVSTAEAMLDRRIADLEPEERADLEIDLSPRELLIDYLTNAFPTTVMEPYLDDAGKPRSRIALDEKGNPVISAAAEAARDELIEKLCALPTVQAALDALVRHYGADSVAEITGRTRRLVTAHDGSQKIETRSGRSNIAETQAFMDGAKRILVFSDAGGTGRSYHADKTARNQQRRIHYLLEPGWRADAAIQGLGRSHRTHQASAPLFRPVTTDVKGEKRFISTIARRLDSLGALTRGQRQTGGQNLFNAADNLESDHAKEALTNWYHLLAQGKLEAIDITSFQQRSGLSLLDKETGGLKEDLPPIQRWLNRLLAFPIALQNTVFEEYFALVEARAEALAKAGKLDIGIETIRAEKIVEVEAQLLRTDPYTGATTHLRTLELHRRPRVLTWGALCERFADNDRLKLLRNERSGMVAAALSQSRSLSDSGDLVPIIRLFRPTRTETLVGSDLADTHWHEIDRDTAEALWRHEAEQAAAQLDVSTVQMITGLLLPIWGKIPGDDIRVWRVSVEGGVDHLGRVIEDADVPELAKRLGASIAVKLDPKALVASTTGRRSVPLPGTSLELAQVRVNGSLRLEVRGYDHHRLAWYKSLGMFTEVISFKTRLFVPPDKAEAIIALLCTP